MKEQPNFESKEKVKECDFYFSKKQAKSDRDDYFEKMKTGDIPRHLEESFIDGKQYTGWIEKGEKPSSTFDDLEFVGTGSFGGENITLRPMEPDTFKKTEALHEHWDDLIEKGLAEAERKRLINEAKKYDRERGL